MKNIFALFVSILLITSLACSLPGAGGTPTDTGEQAPAGEEASAVPTAAPATEVVISPVASSECDNPLLPVKAGATWTYDLQGPVPDTFTRSILSVDGNTFKDQDVFGVGTVRQGDWKCEGGNLISLNPNGGSTASVSAGGETSTFTSTTSEGVTLPVVVNVGDTWSQKTSFEGTNNAGGVSTNTRNTFTTNCTADGTESVTVPAGTFEAIKVTCTIKIEITILTDSGDASAPIVVDTASTSWYAPGVGWVKSVSTGSGFDSTIELTAYTIP